MLALDLIANYDEYLGTRKMLAFDQLVNVFDEAQRYGFPSADMGGSGECAMHGCVPRCFDYD